MAVSKIKGISNDEFDGVSLPTLRAWKRYWENEDRSKDDPFLATRDRTRNLRMIAVEIGRREEARTTA